MNVRWTDAELKLAIKAYLKMLKWQKDGTPFVKAEQNRTLQQLLPGRTIGSIEYRWQNISAVLAEKKRKYVIGYLPAQNVGAAVKEKIWHMVKSLEQA